MTKNKVTQEEINLNNVVDVNDEVYFELEDKYGRITSIIVNDPETGMQSGEFLFKSPTNFVIKMANQAIIKDEDIGKYNDVIINNCSLNGLDLIKENEDVRRAIHDKVKMIITPLEATMGKRRQRPKDS
ncbi:hypothetical protein [Microscilla marina]|uniref:Uncharacterized protein n=1 Tax=Microscilla marina ATCC 23134 TaxID=313606 RepID=A1ZLH7_MICM2|nr:hypothetical protein [Microscilla marina]EAY28731.1 hypothetical protein M23134_07829 [Microscilla marina ATCC 23134]